MDIVLLTFIIIGFILFIIYVSYVKTLISEDFCKNCGRRLPEDTNKPGYCDNDCYYDRK